VENCAQAAEYQWEGTRVDFPFRVCGVRGGMNQIIWSVSNEFSFFIIQRNYRSQARMQPGSVVLPRADSCFRRFPVYVWWRWAPVQYGDNPAFLRLIGIMENASDIVQKRRIEKFTLVLRVVFLGQRQINETTFSAAKRNRCGIRKIATVYILLMNSWERLVWWEQANSPNLVFSFNFSLRFE